MRSARNTRGFLRLAVALVLTGGVLLSTVSLLPQATAQAPKRAGATTLQVWLGGLLTTATPGSFYRKWVNYVDAQFEKKYPGTNIALTLLPADNNQLAAKVESAFASHQVPDLMFLYSGAYTTVYSQGLLKLNNLVNSTPGFYKSLSNWNLSCTNLNCENGKGTIVGIPADLEGFFLFYNKKLFAKAGLHSLPTTWKGLLNACKTLKAKGITPMTYGDQEGYTTVNFLDEELGSYITQATMNAVLSGHAKMTTNAFANALNTVEQLRTGGCSQSNASTVKQLNALNAFSAGQTAMVEMYPGLLDTFEAGIGAKSLGVGLIPGAGPLGTHVASNSADYWVIPAQSSHINLAWDYIKVALNNPSSLLYVKAVALPSANVSAGRNIADPLLRYMAAQINLPSNIEEFDSVIPNGVALYLYRELNLFFAGQTSAQQVLSTTQTQMTRALQTH